MQAFSHLSHSTKVGAGSAAAGASLLLAGWASGIFKSAPVRVSNSGSLRYRKRQHGDALPRHANGQHTVCLHFLYIPQQST